MRLEVAGIPGKGVPESSPRRDQNRSVPAACFLIGVSVRLHHRDPFRRAARRPAAAFQHSAVPWISASKAPAASTAQAKEISRFKAESYKPVGGASTVARSGIERPAVPFRYDLNIAAEA